MIEEAAPSAFELTRVTTLTGAISQLRKMTADCVVVDLGLPDGEGLEVVETLAGCAPTVALIALTDREDEDLGVATIDTGASDYLCRQALDGKLLVRSIRFAIRRKRFEASLAEAQRIACVGSWELDLSTAVMSWSRELARLFGFAPSDRPAAEALVSRVHPDDRTASVEVMRATLKSATPYVVEHRILLPDGTERWIRARGRVELDRAGLPSRLLGTAQDITEQRKADEARVYLAFHDPLTDLPNRVLLLDRLGQCLRRLGRHPGIVSVIYLDIDRFRVINDSLGREVGDELLLAMATRLGALVRPGDTVARAGGDEFVVLCEGMSDEAEAIRLADRIGTVVAEPVYRASGDLVLSVSTGLALASSSSVSPELLLRDAEAAMHGAKGGGQRVFAETMRTKAMGRLATEVALRQSIADGDLRVHYQPIVSLLDGQVIGHEALVRWAHPTRGLLQPDDFISVAEETGLIAPLGAFVLRQACLQARRFQALDPMWARLTMSVNLSGAQLQQPDLVELIASALHDAALRPEHLQLEMTESVLMDDAPHAITILQTLKGLGVRLGVDDFGTGYSSLSYLRRFPVDVLKIDKSFVGGLGSDNEASAAAVAVVSLADALGLTTIAEGVETKLQRDCLIGLGCSRAQGYLFARPASASQCEEMLEYACHATASPTGDGRRFAGLAAT